MSGSFIQAAVLIPVLASPDLANEPSSNSLEIRGKFARASIPRLASVLLTKRTNHVEHHKGQIAFPGGTLDEADSSLEHTALREAEEEIGLRAADIELIDELPDVLTLATHFRVRPFVAMVRGQPAFAPNPSEIDEILFVPISHLLDPARSEMEWFERNGVKYKLKTYHFGEHRIWGATARMLESFLARLHARS